MGKQLGFGKILEEDISTLRMNMKMKMTMMEEEEGEGGGGGGKVCVVIEKATNSTSPEVDPRLLKLIKSLVRDSESELRLAAHTLMSLMKRDHSQVTPHFSFNHSFSFIFCIFKF